MGAVALAFAGASVDEPAAGRAPELHLRRTEMLGSCAAVWADEEGLLAAERAGKPG